MPGLDGQSWDKKARKEGVGGNTQPLPALWGRGCLGPLLGLTVRLCLRWSVQASALALGVCVWLPLMGQYSSGSPALCVLLSLAVWVCLCGSASLHLICVHQPVPSMSGAGPW